ncbi:MAG: hypothetical protein JXR49_16145 [Acidobacteria bacterium]|nr:hypothetical protein [Acidobacteriota bacterium]
MKTTSYFSLKILALLLFIPFLNAQSLETNTETFLSEPAAGNQRYPVSIHANGSHLVVWQEGNDAWEGDSRIMGLIIKDDGTYSSSFVISNMDDVQERPVVTTDGINFLVLWQDFRNGTDYDIYGARVDASGHVLDPSGIAIGTGTGNQCIPSVAFDDNNFIAIWMDNSLVPQSYHIRGTRIAKNGDVFDKPGVYIAGPNDAAAIENIITTGNMLYVSALTMPTIACQNQSCLIGFLAKDNPSLSVKDDPQFIRLNTNTDISVLGSPILLADSAAYSPTATIWPAKATDGIISIESRNDGTFLSAYTGANSKASRNYFVVALPMDNSSELSPPTVGIRKSAFGGHLENIATVVKDDSILFYWSDYNGVMLYPTLYSIRGAILHKDNSVSTFSVFDSVEYYRGFPSGSIGSSTGLLVYEKDSGSGRIQLAGILYDRNSLPLAVIPDDPPIFDFSMSNGGDVSVAQGNSVSNSITLSLLSGSTEPVTFSVEGLPTHISAEFSSASCSPTCSNTITLRSTDSSVTGTYPLTVTATSDAISYSTEFSLIISSADEETLLPPGDLRITYLDGIPTD